MCHQVIGQTGAFIIQPVRVIIGTRFDEAFGGVFIYECRQLGVGNGIIEIPDGIWLGSMDDEVNSRFLFLEDYRIGYFGLEISLVRKIHLHLFDGNRNQTRIEDYRSRTDLSPQPFFKLGFLPFVSKVIECNIRPEQSK